MYRLLVLLSPLVVAIAASHDAAVPAGQAYWNKVLPNTPMPNAIKDLLTPSTDEFTDNKYGTAVNVGKGGVSVNTGKPKPGGTSVNVGKGGVTVNTGKQKPGGTSVNVGHGGVNVNTGKGRPGGTNVNVGHGGVNVNTGSGKGTSVNVGHGGVIVNTPPKKKPVHVAVGVKGSPFIYKYAATENQVRDDPNTALFFLEKDLQAGTQMTLHFTPTTSGPSTFISRQQANSIPFTSSKFPEILKHFSVEPNSVEADSMKETLSVCEEPANEGESKYCATSLESMVDFSMTSIGSHKIQAVSTNIGKKNSPKQLYSISSSGIQRLPGSNLVVCHAEAYAYAVFYCHTTRSTKAYQVSMVGKDGTKVEAVAVCHTDTASWNPKHIAFKVLNVKPGSVPVCHFLPQDHLVWSPKR